MICIKANIPEELSQIDDEVKRIINESYERAENLISEHRDKVEAIANELMERETLDGDQVAEIVKTGKLSDKSNGDSKGDGPSGAEAATPTSDDVASKKPPEEESGLGTSPAPAPA